MSANQGRWVKKSERESSKRSRQAREAARADEPEIEHDDDCADAIRYGGACRHYCPSGCCDVE